MTFLNAFIYSQKGFVGVYMGPYTTKPPQTLISVETTFISFTVDILESSLLLKLQSHFTPQCQNKVLL